jgi:general secretion pathway protein K
MDRANLRKAIKRRKARKKQRGIALIMVLGAITILTVFLTELQTDTTSAVAGALAERDRLKAEYYAKSAVNLSRMLLAAEKPIRVSIGPILQLALQTKKIPQIPVWEFSDHVLGAFNGGDRATQFGTKVGVDISTAKNVGIPGNGYYNVTIVDEDSKINVNSASSSTPPIQLIQQLMTMFMQPQYATMFEERDGDEQFSDAPTLCGAIVDWADPDENLTNCLDVSKAASGSEDNIYQMLGLGYQRKNAPYDSLEELRLTRGMDDDRWATFVDPDPADPHKRVLTVWGQETGVAPINVNTAPAQVLWAVTCSMATLDTPMCVDPVQAAAFIQVVSLVRTFARGVPLFPTSTAYTRAVEGKDMIGTFLSSLGVQPVQWDPVRGKRSERRKVFKSESKMFSIYAEGVVPGTQREARVRIHMVVDMREAVDWNQKAQEAQNGGPPADETTAGKPGMLGVPEDDAPVDDEFIKEMKTNPFGTVIYYRVD